MAVAGLGQQSGGQHADRSGDPGVDFAGLVECLVSVVRRAEVRSARPAPRRVLGCGCSHGVCLLRRWEVGRYPPGGLTTADRAQAHARHRGSVAHPVLAASPPEGAARPGPTSLTARPTPGPGAAPGASPPRARGDGDGRPSSPLEGAATLQNPVQRRRQQSDQDGGQRKSRRIGPSTRAGQEHRAVRRRPRPPWFLRPLPGR